MRNSIFSSAVAGILATAVLASPAGAFQGNSVSAKDCSYGGKIKSIEAVDALTVRFSMCKPDPAFMAKAAFTPFGIQATLRGRSIPQSLSLAQIDQILSIMSHSQFPPR